LYFSWVLNISFSSKSIAQQKFTLNGYLKDSLSGETLIGANLFAKMKDVGLQVINMAFIQSH